jgi:hypothetical protein
MSMTFFAVAMTMILQPTLEHEYPWPHNSMKYHPETVMPGDTLYVLLEVKNPYEQPVFISDKFRPTEGDIQIRLHDSKQQSHPLLFELYVNWIADYPLFLVEIKPGETRVIGALAINIPALEDIHEPFWERNLEEISREGSEFLLQVSVFYRPWDSDILPRSEEALLAFWEKGFSPKDFQKQEMTLEQKIFLKPRSVTEMTMIEKWYDNTPKGLFPEPEGRTLTIRLAESKCIRVQDKNFSQWHFIYLGNRYPSDPNAPATWQGWRELEESITPSTMRDEIRLTRILIQYCDTRDVKVLDELKEWFAGMNEVQRACMAKSICDRAKNCHGTDLLVPFRDLYKTIREYDIAAKPDCEIEWLKQLGLLE